MSVYNLIGWIMLAMPFVAAYVFIAKEYGWRIAALFFLAGSAAIGFIELAVYLANL